MSRFQEFKNKKMNPTPKVSVDGDTVPASPNQMPKPFKGKYSTGSKTPHTSPEKGFGDMGEKVLKLDYDIKNPHGKAPAKMPTAEAVTWTSDMAEAMTGDPSLIEHMVRQIKQRGLLGALVAEVFSHKDACKCLAQIATHEAYGPKVVKDITRAINEEVAPPFHDQLEGEEEEDEDEQNPDEENDEEDPDLEGDVEDPNGGQNADPNAPMDPNMMGGMDPSMMGMDPNMGGMDPSMMGGMPPMDPSMMGGAPPMGGMQPAMPPMPPGQMPPMNPMMPPMMKAFQQAMMRAYQRANMRK